MSAAGSSYAAALAAALALVGLGCRAGHDQGASSAAPSPASTHATVVELVPPLPVDHGQAPAYAGEWIGAELRLTFAGPWVLVGPVAAGPGAQPIELRVTVERREGDAYALRTSVADHYAGDFVRPSDWTLLIEDGAIAVAMGDEPLTSYVRAATDVAPLLGPAMLAELPIPDTIAAEQVLACVELASQRCRALEAEGPHALGCREAVWATCVAYDPRGAADPTVRAAIDTARRVDVERVVVRFALAVHAATPDDPAAHAVVERARTQAREALTKLRADGPLPSDDPHLAALEWMLDQAD